MMDDVAQVTAPFVPYTTAGTLHEQPCLQIILVLKKLFFPISNICLAVVLKNQFKQFLKSGFNFFHLIIDLNLVY